MSSVRGQILALMPWLVQETGVATLVVTHHLALAWNVADRIAVMYPGGSVEIGTTVRRVTPSVHARAAAGRSGRGVEQLAR